MKVYIVYDKRNGAILHKFRMASLKQEDTEDTLDCKAKDVLSSYRGTQVPRKYLAVDTVAKYQPRSSRDRVVRFSAATRRLVAKAPEPISPRGSGSKPKANATSRKEK